MQVSLSNVVGESGPMAHAAGGHRWRDFHQKASRPTKVPLVPWLMEPFSFLHCDNRLTLVDDVIEKPIADPAILLLRRRWPR